MDLVNELREYTYWLGSGEGYSRDIHPPICDKAADRIEELKKERDEAIEAICGICGVFPCPMEGCRWYCMLNKK